MSRARPLLPKHEFVAFMVPNVRRANALRGRLGWPVRRDNVTRRSVLLSALTAAIACAAAAPSPAADDPRDVFRAQAKSVFFDQDVARGAVEDVSRMREPELRAFVRYLAECEDADAGFAADRTVLHSCAVARIEYQLEFEAGRSLDKWIAARSRAFERAETPDRELFSNAERMVSETAGFAGRPGATKERAH
jgi:hypothetical protein